MFTNSESATLSKHDEAIYGSNQKELGLLARMGIVEEKVDDILRLRRLLIATILGLGVDIILRLLFR